MRTASPKRAAQLRERRKMLKRTTHGPERCQWPSGCPNEAVDPDELQSRAQGGSITDRDNIWLLCRHHHDWKHAHPAEARAMGITRSAPACTLSAEPHTVSIMPAKRPITLRVTETADEWINDMATAQGVSRSVVTRAMLSVATAHVREVAAKITALKELT